MSVTIVLSDDAASKIEDLLLDFWGSTRTSKTTHTTRAEKEAKALFNEFIDAVDASS